VPATLPALAEVDAAARQSGLAVDPSELHGALCGWLAAGGAGSPDWLAHVLADDAIPAVATGSTFDQLREASAGQLEDRSFDFELLLPDADAPLSIRSGALFDWCRGFLGGFGLSAGAEPPLSEESRDALTDLGRIAASELSYEDPATDEEALEEVAEFVRVAALLLHSDCVLGPRHRRSLN
jgi:uncharacterized protein YgfB (UPF0149 family)